MVATMPYTTLKAMDVCAFPSLSTDKMNPPMGAPAKVPIIATEENHDSISPLRVPAASATTAMATGP